MGAIEEKSEELFIKTVGSYVKSTPFDKVKNQLVAKIKEIYVPDGTKVAGVVNKMSKLDFVGQDDDETVPAKKKPQTEEEEPPKKIAKKGPALDFT